jgi:hypothetical protein
VPLVQCSLATCDSFGLLHWCVCGLVSVSSGFGTAVSSGLVYTARKSAAASANLLMSVAGGLVDALSSGLG